MSGLMPKTKYYIRSYAISAKGTVYGNELTFETFYLWKVTTSSVSDITINDAFAGGNVFSDVGSIVSSRGVCWSTSSNPTVALATKTNDGNTKGMFSTKITGLQANTRYYVRAYVTTLDGVTEYGSEIVFRTQPTITIGNQVWAQRNLDVSRYRNGDIIPQVKDSLIWKLTRSAAWCWYMNDSLTYAASHGRLYNWYAVKDSRGLCPVGWHIPTETDWITLITYLGGNMVAGGKMKTPTGWNLPNSDATNSSGFGGRPGGLRLGYGAFDGIGNYGFWWWSSATNAGVHNLSYQSAGIGKSYLSSDFTNGNYVRCIKD